MYWFISVITSLLLLLLLNLKKSACLTLTLHLPVFYKQSQQYAQTCFLYAPHGHFKQVQPLHCIALHNALHNTQHYGLSVQMLKHDRNELGILLNYALHITVIEYKALGTKRECYQHIICMRTQHCFCSPREVRGPASLLCIT